MAPTPQRFQGDDEQLVDALVKACQAKVDMPLLPGFGRELIPYEFEDLPHAPRQASAPARKPVARLARKGPATPPATAKPAPFSDNVQAGHKRSPCGRPTTCPNKAAKKAEKRPADKAATVPKTPAPAKTKTGTWAGPGFGNSPTPDTLPLPSATLLAPLRPRSVNTAATVGLKSLLQLSVAA